MFIVDNSFVVAGVGRIIAAAITAVTHAHATAGPSSRSVSIRRRRIGRSTNRYETSVIPAMTANWINLAGHPCTPSRAGVSNVNTGQWNR